MEWAQIRFVFTFNSAYQALSRKKLHNGDSFWRIVWRWRGPQSIRIFWRIVWLGIMEFVRSRLMQTASVSLNCPPTTRFNRMLMPLSSGGSKNCWAANFSSPPNGAVLWLNHDCINTLVRSCLSFAQARLCTKKKKKERDQ